MTMTSHIFGPVPSRRLGKSLGIDMVPYKICSFDCIYCQLGRTTFKTMERKAYIPIASILEELKSVLKQKNDIDYITLSGSGEPTLNVGISEMITGIKKLTSIPVAVITNGSLLWDKQVRSELMDADLVIPSLDAGDEELFQFVNRPCAALNLNKLVDGLLTFSQEYTHALWLEVLLLGGVSAVPEKVDKIATICKKIKHTKIQINTATRPGAESFALVVDTDQLKAFAALFPGNVEVIGSFSSKKMTNEQQHTLIDVLTLLERRPCTLEEISTCLSLHPNHVIKYITELTVSCKIEKIYKNGITYFRKRS